MCQLPIFLRQTLIKFTMVIKLQYKNIVYLPIFIADFILFIFKSFTFKYFYGFFIFFSFVSLFFPSKYLYWFFDLFCFLFSFSLSLLIWGVCRDNLVITSTSSTFFIGTLKSKHFFVFPFVEGKYKFCFAFYSIFFHSTKGFWKKVLNRWIDKLLLFFKHSLNNS